MLRAADAIVIDELRKAGLYRKVQQAFAVLLPVQSVGVMGDDRTYQNVVAVRSRADGRFHDSRLVPPTLRGVAADFDANHELGPWGESSRVRHQFQASEHDRVGIDLSRDFRSLAGIAGSRAMVVFRR